MLAASVSTDSDEKDAGETWTDKHRASGTTYGLKKKTTSKRFVINILIKFSLMFFIGGGECSSQDGHSLFLFLNNIHQELRVDNQS